MCGGIYRLALFAIAAQRGTPPSSGADDICGIEHSPSLSPDGNHVVFTWNGQRRDNYNVYVQQIGSGSPLQLTTAAADDYNPVWSPDGKQIFFCEAKGQRPPEDGSASCGS